MYDATEATMIFVISDSAPALQALAATRSKGEFHRAQRFATTTDMIPAKHVQRSQGQYSVAGSMLKIYRHPLYESAADFLSTRVKWHFLSGHNPSALVHITS